MRGSQLGAALAATCLSVLSSTAFADTSEQAKADARELANAGAKAQSERRYAECVDKFTAAHKLYPEATTLTVRLAQCLVADGRLVEGSEAYRVLAATKVPASAPQVFKDAQATGKAESEQVDKLVPTVVIAVDPTPAPEGTRLHMQRKGGKAEVLGAVWINTPRKVNPGEYSIFATAPGYASKVETVTVAEGDRENVRLLLSAGEEAPVVVDEQLVDEPQAPPIEDVGDYEAPKAPAPGSARNGLILVGGLGVQVGEVSDVGGGSPHAMLDAAVFFRLRKFILGPVLQYDHITKDNGNTIGAVYVGAHFGVLTSGGDKRFGFWLDGGVGYRAVGVAENFDNSGLSLQIGLGPSIPLAKALRLVPKPYVAVGVTSDGADPYAHAIAGLALELHFHVPLGK